MKSKVIVISVLVLILSGIGYVFHFWWNLGVSVGYAPEQPIPFSHKLHAGDKQIPCMYCHINVERSRHATVPSMNVCMNCHSVVKTDSPHIKKLKALYDKGEPIEWTKVHDQPDFVYFNHRPHILKGVSCETCHGDVKKMEKIQQVEKLNMGFCMDCHRQNNAPVSCYTCHH